MNAILNIVERRVATSTKGFASGYLSIAAHSRPIATNLAYSEYAEHCVSSDKPPLLIAHGFLGSKTNWHSMARALNKNTKRKVIAIDMRGHGDSPHVVPYDYDALSEDVIEFLKVRSIPKAIIMGHSMGGRTAVLVALKRPEIVASLVVIDISPFTTPSNPTTSYLEVMRKVQWDPQFTLSEVRKLVDQQLALTVKDISMRQFLATNLIKDDGGIRWKCDLPNFIKYNMAIQNPYSLTGKYDGKTLFIGGGASPYIPKEDHAAIRELFPNVQFEYIPGASHFVHTEKPREFLLCATTFINKSHVDPTN